MNLFDKLQLFKTPLVIYPFLFAAFPIIFLYAYNIAETDFRQTLLPLVLSLAGASILWFLLLLILRDKFKAGLSTFLFLVLFFSYGRVYQSLETYDIFVPGHAYLLPGVMLAWGYCVYFIHRAKRDFRNLTAALNVIAAVLIVINLANISIYQIGKPKVEPSRPVNATGATDNVTDDAKTKRDIYFIILDEYAHPDTIKEWAGYDNSWFINSLKDKGFFIAGQSRTRSPHSPLVIAQVLNMEYLSGEWYWDVINKHFTEITNGESRPSGKYWESEPIYWKYAYNKAADFLRIKGYKYICFGNRHAKGRWDSFMRDNADQYFNYAESSGALWASEFQNILWNSTALRPFYPHLIGSQYEGFLRHEISGTLEHLKEIPYMEGPKFVVAHIMCPHEPFVFGPKGEYVDPLNYRNYRDKQFYLGQYIYISVEIDKVLSALQKESKSPPIIILQSDHGLRPGYPGQVIGKDEWHKILNALYLPGVDKAVLYDSISPVNTFRLIFNQYFGTDYELLPDK